MRRLVAVLALLLAPVTGHAGEAERQAAQAVIARQIEAFRTNDPATAYAQAAPQIRSLFPTPETFLAMVEKGYKPVLRPRSYRFEKAEEAGDGEIAQGLSLQDEDGVDWIALYALQKQADGAWRITGCTLRKAPGDNA